MTLYIYQEGSCCKISPVYNLLIFIYNYDNTLNVKSIPVFINSSFHNTQTKPIQIAIRIINLLLKFNDSLSFESRRNTTKKILQHKNNITNIACLKKAWNYHCGSSICLTFILARNEIQRVLDVNVYSYPGTIDYFHKYTWYFRAPIYFRHR